MGTPFLKMVVSLYRYRGCLWVRKLRVYKTSNPLKLFCGVKYVTLVPYNTEQQNLHHLQNNYLECVKEKKGLITNLLSDKYINTIEIIKLFRVNIFMPVTKLPFLTIFLFCKKRPFRIFDQFRGLFQETNSKN